MQALVGKYFWVQAIVFKEESEILRKSLENNLRETVGFAAEEAATYAALRHGP
jgi:hypothetical protein